jgi:hypothetical protein
MQKVYILHFWMRMIYGFQNKLEIQVNILENNIQYDLIDANAYTIDENGNKLGMLNIKKVYKLLKNISQIDNILILSNFININTVLMKNNNLEIKFREDTNLIAIEDWLFWIENIENGKKIFLCKEFLINYRIVNNSISNRNSDIGYRRIFYMYSWLFLNRKVSIFQYIKVFIFNSIKIIIKK